MNENKKIRVMIVEDSVVKRELLMHILCTDPDIEVIGYASNGKDAIRNIKEKKPDIVTMDINMPGINGFEAARIILEECPLPIVVISSIRSKHNKNEVAKAMLACGALQFIDSPPGPWHPDFDLASKNIIRNVKVMSQLKVFTRHKKRKPVRIPKSFKSIPLPETAIIAIGVSTGGPPLLKEILKGLPKDFNFPIVIVQHISAGFDSLLADNLNTVCNLNIKLAEHGEKVRPGNVYIAPGKYNLTIDTDYKICLIANPTKFNKIVPSADALFNSIADVYARSAIGILLTGMGADGAQGLKAMKDKGAVTIIQDEESSVVYGMPKEARKIHAQKFVMTPREIILHLMDVNSKLR
jgi:two-component system, chemotaxis family, protein-glutamate methylesterase/glutaminase